MRGAIVAAVMLAGVVVAPHAPAAERPCTEPTLERYYTQYDLVVRMEVDLAGCSWWRGRTIRLAGSVDRLGAGAGNVAADKACRGAAARCTLQIVLRHPDPEAAVYAAEASYPWRGGRRTTTFTEVCTTATHFAGCEP